uniref:2',5'-phosphodiesterase 12 n=2 Tax=Cacopsylla melanoneura TaxID=428564 RepID=A0A8D8RZ77_9HEMI
MKLFKSFYNTGHIVSNHFSILLAFKRFKSASAYPRLTFSKPHIMNPAYFRYEDGAEKFQVAFEYNNETYHISRQFNMDRSVNETIADFKKRIKSNVVKALEKKIHALNKKKDKDEKIKVPEAEIDLVIDGQVISDTSIAKEAIFDSSSTSGENSLLISDSKFQIIINAPWIKNLTLPSCILQDCLLYPTKFEHQFLSEDKTIFQWFRKEDKEFVPLGQGFYYKPTKEDVGHHLKLSCTPKNEHSEGPTLEVITEKPVDAGNQPYLFEQRHAFTKEKLTGDNFRVVTYNILAEIYADTDTARNELFSYCPSYALDMQYRRPLIIRELLAYHADLICLQEVDEKCFNRHLSPTLLREGNYQSDFAVKSGNAAEGLAIFYDADKFRFIQSSRYLLGESLAQDHVYHNDLVSRIKTNERLYTRISERNTTLQTVVLEPLNSKNKRLLYVANTHLYFHPDSDHIRLAQSALFLAYIQWNITKLRQSKPGYEVSLIFCGDFNSSPDCGMYRLMTQNQVPPDVDDWRSNPDERIEGIPLTQPYPMASACGTPEFTNYTLGFSGCLDYIYYQKDHMKVTQVIPFPSKEELELYSGLPSPVYPSDHLALIADLQWIESSNSQA